LEIIPFEADDISNESNAVDQLTIDEAGNSRTYKCDKLINGVPCGKSFPRKFSLKVHYLTHTDERPFECDEIVNGESCGKTFKSGNKLQTHKKIHAEHLFVCAYIVDGKPCGKTFPTQYFLKRHTELSARHCHDSHITQVRFWTFFYDIIKRFY